MGPLGAARSAHHDTPTLPRVNGLVRRPRAAATAPPAELAHLVGGAVDLADLDHQVEVDLAGQPVNAAAAAAADLEPDDETLVDEMDGEDDEFGDAALAVELGVTPVQPIGGPLEF